MLKFLVFLCVILCACYIRAEEAQAPEAQAPEAAEATANPEMDAATREILNSEAFSMENIKKSLSDDCATEMEEQKGEDEVSEKCKEEIQNAFKIQLEEMMKNKKPNAGTRTKRPRSKTKRSKKSKSNTNTTLMIIFGFVIAAVLALVGACVYINGELGKAGMHQPKEQKKLSKRKQEKLNRKEKYM